MGRGLFTTFRSRVAEAEQRGFGMQFAEAYLYVLLPGGMLYYVERLHYFITTYVEAKRLPWYELFSDPGLALLFGIYALTLACVIWQFIALLRFSRCFFIPLLSVIVFFVALHLTYAIGLDDPSALTSLLIYIPYGLVIYYYYKRKILFSSIADRTNSG